MQGPGRGIVLGVALAIPLWLIVAAVAVSCARSAPSLQVTADRTAQWASDVLNAPVGSRSITTTDDLVALNAAGQYDPGDDTIQVRPWVAAMVATGFDATATRGRFDAFGPHVLLHELLHRRDTIPCNGPLDEGATDALATDLGAAWTARFWRRRDVESVPAYPVEVAAVRAASRYATGSRSWRDRSARLWRRTLWAATCDGRRTVMLQAEAARP